jgi:hypothetical protein
MSDAFERAADQEEAEFRERHRRRESQGHRTGFRIHLATFIGVQVLIFVVWLVVWQTSGDGYPWFLFPLLAWGVGVLAHYAAVRDVLRRHR